MNVGTDIEPPHEERTHIVANVVAPVAERFSIVEFTTPHLSLADDLDVYARAGSAGIGIAEAKLTDDAADLSRLRQSGLVASSVMPHVATILPASGVAGPPDPVDRVVEIGKAIDRAAAFEPSCFTVAAGPVGELAPDEAWAIVRDGMRVLSERADGHGMTLAVELMHPTLATVFSFLTDIVDGIALLDEIEAPSAALALDTWHVSEDPDLLEHLERYASRIATLHVNDRRVPTRSWADRVLPGDGDLALAEMVAALGRGGFDGWFELEVISDDGSITEAFDDSLWKLDPFEFVRDGRSQFLELTADQSRP
jgi:sugar phosphate isomerase/epimerase